MAGRREEVGVLDLCAHYQISDYHVVTQIGLNNALIHNSKSYLLMPAILFIIENQSMQETSMRLAVERKSALIPVAI